MHRNNIHSWFLLLKVGTSHHFSMHLKITNFEREEINFAVHRDSDSKPDTVFAPRESSQGVRGSQSEGSIGKLWPIRSQQLPSLCNQRRVRLQIGKLHWMWKYQCVLFQFTMMYNDKTCSRSRMTLGPLKYKMLELIVKIVLVLAVVNLALLFGNLFYFDRWDSGRGGGLLTL